MICGKWHKTSAVNSSFHRIYSRVCNFSVFSFLNNFFLFHLSHCDTDTAAAATWHVTDNKNQTILENDFILMITRDFALVCQCQSPHHINTSTVIQLRFLFFFFASVVPLICRWCTQVFLISILWRCCFVYRATDNCERWIQNSARENIRPNEFKFFFLFL